MKEKKYVYEPEEKLPKVLNEFLVELNIADGKSKDTIRSYSNHITQFLQYIIGKDTILKKRNLDIKEMDKIDISKFSKEDIKNITRDNIKDFIKYCSIKRNNANSSIGNKISALQTFYNYLIEENIVENNLMVGIKKPKIAKKERTYLDVDDTRALRNIIKVSDSKFVERDYCILTLFITCGLRNSELVSIDLNEIDFKNEMMVVIGKGNKERTISLASACISAINNYLPVRKEQIKMDNMNKDDKDALFISEKGNRIAKSTVAELIKKYAELAGLDKTKVYPHKLRHTFASLTYQGGADVLELQKILGHENISTTQIYTHANAEQIKKAMNNNPFASEE